MKGVKVKKFKRTSSKYVVLLLHTGPSTGSRDQRFRPSLKTGIRDFNRGTHRQFLPKYIKLQGLKYYFPENFRCKLNGIMKERIF